ncbi:hypothetical protein C7S16_0950 [Burkholderia thailandensis]|uniref:Lipoprotein n=1 Tax=Burkholderia thailandensis TaxID=57975 RepID=A0AAW9D6B0_BURTH|nr:hypothetical protein [Burkholderia thailandensis]MDW9257555.1 hypothetical protein [Burkholderia thailandensis]
MQPTFSAASICTFSCGCAWPSVASDAIVAISRDFRSSCGRL